MRPWLSALGGLIAIAGCAASQPATPASATASSPASPGAAYSAASPALASGGAAGAMGQARPPAASSLTGPGASASAAPFAGGACWRLAQSAARPAAAARLSTECVAGSPEVERDVAARLVREVKDGDARRAAHIDYPCVTPRNSPGLVRAVIVEGHAGQARVVGLSSSGAGAFRARVLRVATGGGPNQAPSGPVEFFRTDLSEAAVIGSFDRMRTALAARITLESPPAVQGNRIELSPAGMSSNNLSIELVLEDTLGASAARAWHGYRGTLDAENRLPVEFAWRALSELGLEKLPFRAPQPDDRALLREAWLTGAAGFERPWYTTRGLLLLAAVAGSAELIPRLVELLASADEEIQRLSVDALAAISGRDVRRDRAGEPRPLVELVADYRRECGPP